VASVLLVLARGINDPFEVDAPFCTASLGSDPRFSLSGDAAVAEEADMMVAVGAEGVAVALLSGAMDRKAALCALSR
jgi:hypothetical protein